MSSLLGSEKHYSLPVETYKTFIDQSPENSCTSDIESDPENKNQRSDVKNVSIHYNSI